METSHQNQKNASQAVSHAVPEKDEKSCAVLPAQRNAAENHPLLKDAVWKKTSSVYNLHEGALPYFSFRALDETGLVVNAFTTKYGGVSTGHLTSLNLTYAKEGETPLHVTENYRRVAARLGLSVEKMVLSQQTHTTNVRLVTEADAGVGVTKPRDYTDVDGLICNIPGMTLVTFYADCVPLYLLDPVHHAIGLSHSGWRGTVSRMGAVTIRRMQEAFGTKPEDLICCIGPSICKNCFEVGGEVAQAFAEAFQKAQMQSLIFHPDQTPVLRTEGMPSKDAKYYIDLWHANELVFQKAGVKPENIHTGSICTKCNPQLFWSHRVFGTKRGNQAAFLSLKENKNKAK